MIYCECKPDEVLLKELCHLRKREYIHFSNKSEACKKLEKEKNKIALLDKDPNSNQPRYLNNLQSLSNFNNLNLEIRYDPRRGNKIILLNPYLEGWILKIARKVSVNPEIFGLPDTPEKLHQVINQKLEHFRRLLQTIKEKKPKEFEVLKRELRG